MRVRRLDGDHDWTFGGGISDYATESEAIAQSIRTQLLSLYGDWFLNREHGVHWQNYLKKNPNIREMETEIKKVVLNTTGVEKLTDFSIYLDPDTRKITVTINYVDIYGKESEVSTNAPSN